MAIDLNAELMLQMTSNPNYNKITDFFIHNNLHSEIFEDVTKLIDLAANRILSFNAKKVGLSLLTSHSQVFTHWLCIRLKTLSPNTEIIIGGPGIKSTIVSDKNQFCTDLIDHVLIDHYITGDGELALVELLKGNYNYPGINSSNWEQIRDIENFPYPNYDDYDFGLYLKPTIPITDSRGCVRTCEFCDIIEHWKKFTYRSAKSVFNEMLAQVKKYKIYNFSFMNSLTNGNLREFKELMNYIAEYNKKNNQDEQMSWSGYFIIRSESQHPEELWQVMAKTNPYLFLGVESVVQHVRWGLGKKFNNEDIDYHLDMAKKYSVPLMVLLIVGYPTETRDDYEFTKQWFQDRVEMYGYGNPVRRINLSHATILENTQLERNMGKLNLSPGEFHMNWFSKKTQISIVERSQYWNELSEICKPFGLPSGVRLDGYKSLEKMQYA